MKYICLLRGINVGGNNKVPMSELRSCFEDAGYQNVTTYINSGNVIFESRETDEAVLVKQCESAIVNRFGFAVVCAIISRDELHRALAHAPAWWGSGADKHNAIFAIAPATAQSIMNEVGVAKPEYESVAGHGKVIFWTAPLQTFSRSRYSKIVGTAVYKSITIRNENTTRKLAELTL